MTENYIHLNWNVENDERRLNCARKGHKLKAKRKEGQEWTYVCDECQMYWTSLRIS